MVEFTVVKHTGVATVNLVGDVSYEFGNPEGFFSQHMDIGELAGRGLTRADSAVRELRRAESIFKEGAGRYSSFDPSPEFPDASDEELFMMRANTRKTRPGIYPFSWLEHINTN